VEIAAHLVVHKILWKGRITREVIAFGLWPNFSVICSYLSLLILWTHIHIKWEWNETKRGNLGQTFCKCFHYPNFDYMLSYPEQTFSSIYYLNDFMGSSCDVLGGFSGPGLMVSHFKSQLSWPVHLPRPLTHTHTHTLKLTPPIWNWLVILVYRRSLFFLCP